MYKQLITGVITSTALLISANAVHASTQTDFINKLTPSVKQATAKYNLYPSLQMAQAALESGWGQSKLSIDANNYFGIKGTYNGQYVIMNTAEYDDNGNLYYTDAQFRKYPSPTESMCDNADKLRNGVTWNSQIYSGTWRENAANGREAAKGLYPSYATDPKYVTKLQSLIDDYDLQSLDNNYTAKYKVGDKVQIASFALNESNGYDLTPHQNWVGTIKQVTAKDSGVSHFEYYVDYGDGTRNEHVLEQDLQAAPAAKYKVGDTVQVADIAGAGTDGGSLVKYRGQVGKITSVSIKNHASSNYQYNIDKGNGNIVRYISEQDLQAAPASKYKVGDSVQVASFAGAGTDGGSLIKYRGQIGTVTSVSIKNHASSNYQYNIDKGNGNIVKYISEQDLQSPQSAKFKVGDTIQLTTDATTGTDGGSLTKYRDQIGTVVSVSQKNFEQSAYQYNIDKGNGNIVKYIPEQFLMAATPAKYKVGDVVQVVSVADAGTDGGSLVKYRGQIGTITSVSVKNHASSKYQYNIDKGNGNIVKYISEQDLSVAPVAKFNVGQTARISDVAETGTDGGSLIKYRGVQVVVTKVGIKNYGVSNYEYWVDKGAGNIVKYVSEQDLVKN
ncbi:glycoside hydrolase family 73 protein [Weissella confusa]